jgi:acylphosphatase
MAAACFRVGGKVQGVWFRASTREEAVRLGLRGYARNLPDGDVEVLAIGDEDALQRLAVWLQVGPPMARVDAVQRVDVDPGVEAATGAGFEVA